MLQQGGQKNTKNKNIRSQLSIASRVGPSSRGSGRHVNHNDNLGLWNKWASERGHVDIRWLPQDPQTIQLANRTRLRALQCCWPIYTFQRLHISLCLKNDSFCNDFTCAKVADIKFYIRFYTVRTDRLCGLVVRVLGYRSGGPGSIFDSWHYQKKNCSGSGTGSTQPREYNWGATW
jgi:hypothetical protein